MGTWCYFWSQVFKGKSKGPRESVLMLQETSMSLVSKKNKKKKERKRGTSIL